MTTATIALTTLQRDLMSRGYLPQPFAPVTLLRAACSLVCECCWTADQQLAFPYWRRGKAVLVCRCQRCQTEVVVDPGEDR